LPKASVTVKVTTGGLLMLTLLIVTVGWSAAQRAAWAAMASVLVNALLPAVTPFPAPTGPGGPGGPAGPVAPSLPPQPAISVATAATKAARIERIKLTFMMLSITDRIGD